jgi:uncharacterized protein YecE (DUF72 family)
MKYEPSINIGTSGWSYKDWIKLFYPASLKQTEWLRFYAQTFKTTEINTSFYHTPAVTTTAGWKSKVPADFVFCPKMSRYLTHMKKLNDAEPVMQRFFDAFLPMKRKIGPVLVQLPAVVAWDKDKAENFYRICKTHYGYYRFAMEVRHQSWLEPASIDQMKKYNIAFVISQSGTGFPYAELITAQHIYVRFHGPEALYASGYPDKQLKQFASLFRKWKKEGHSVWAYFNNDIGGHAIRDAKQLIRFCSPVNAA